MTTPRHDPRFRGEAPPVRCPRCAEPARGTEPGTCSRCGLRDTCPQCGEPYGDPIGQRFCSTCATRLAQPAWPPQPAPYAAASPSAETRPSRLAGLFNQVADQIPHVPPLSTRVRRRGVRSAKRKYRQLTTNIGKLYVDLGEALMEDRRFEEAIAAYRHALDESGGSPEWRSKVHASLAESAIDAAAEDPDLRSDALRVALEASQLAPETLQATARSVLRLAESEFLDAHAGWIAEEWLPDVSKLPLETLQRTYCGLLGARCAVYTGAYGQALEQVRELRSASANLLPSLARTLMRDPLVPPPVAAAGLADTHWALAQVLEAAGDDAHALHHIEAALAAGFTGSGDAEVSALGLRADLLARRGDQTQAAACRLQLGRLLWNRGRLDEAISAFELATREDEGVAEPWWQLADVLRSSAMLTDPPYLDAAAIERARDALERGFALRLPTTRDDAWAYCVLALVSEGMSAFIDDVSEARWSAVLAAERSLALANESADAWALSSRYCRLVGLYQSAAVACERALALDASNTLAAAEAVTIQVEVGEPEAALDVVERHKVTLGTSDGSLESVAGYLLLLAGREASALERLDAAIASGDEPFRRLFRGVATMLREGVGAAAADLRWVDDHTRGAVGYGVERAWALWLLEDYDAAERRFKALARSPGLDAVIGAAGLGLCAATRGDIDRAEQLIVAAAHALPGTGPLLALILRLLQQRIGDPRIAALVERATAASAEGPGTDATPATAAAELERAAAATETGSVAWAAAQACRGRWALMAEDWERALAIYDAIERAAARMFPEGGRLQSLCLQSISERAERRGDVETVDSVQVRLAALGESTPWEQAVAVASAQSAAGHKDEAAVRLVALLDAEDGAGASSPEASKAIADLLLKLRHPGDAKRALKAGLTSAQPGSAGRGRLEARLGLIAALGDDILDARQWLVHAVQSTAAEKGDAKVGRVVSWCEQLIDEADRPRLDAAIRALLDDPRLTRAQQEELAARRFRRSRERRLNRARVRPVSPVVLSVDALLLADHAELAERLADDVCPAVRERMQARAGIRMPGARVQAHTDGAGKMDYAILVREVPVRIGQVPESRNGRLGTAELARVLGDELEDALRPRLADFVGISEVGVELVDWAARGDPDTRVAILERAHPSGNARPEFARAVHRLVDEQVPVDHMGTLLTAFAEARDHQLPAMATIEHVRTCVAHRLEPGRFDRNVLELDTSTEAQIARCIRPAGAHSFLAIPLEDVPGLLATVERQLAGAPPSGVAIVVEQAELRPFVQRLVDSNWRGIAVLSRAELAALPPDRSRAASAVAAAAP